MIVRIEGELLRRRRRRPHEDLVVTSGVDARPHDAVARDLGPPVIVRVHGELRRPLGRRPGVDLRVVAVVALPHHTVARDFRARLVVRLEGELRGGDGRAALPRADLPVGAIPLLPDDAIARDLHPLMVVGVEGDLRRRRAPGGPREDLAVAADVVDPHDAVAGDLRRPVVVCVAGQRGGRPCRCQCRRRRAQQQQRSAECDPGRQRACPAHRSLPSSSREGRPQTRDGVRRRELCPLERCPVPARLYAQRPALRSRRLAERPGAAGVLAGSGHGRGPAAPGSFA